MTSKMAEEITYAGNYNVLGDRVRITGQYVDACHQHGGEADIHCNQLVVIETGMAQKEVVSIYKIAAMIALVMIAIILSLYYYRIYRKTGYYADESI